MYLNFNPGASYALQSLNSLNAQLQQTTFELSTGKAINSAADNPGLWAEATTLESDAGAWGVVAGEVSGASSPELTTATSGLSSVLSTLGAMRTELEGVQSGTTSATTALQSLQQSGATLQATVAEASVNGVNFLDGSTGGSVSFAEGYDRTGAAPTVTLATEALADSAGGGLLQTAQASASATATNVTALTASDLTSANVATTLSNLNQAIADVTSYSASIGNMSATETSFQQFAQSMQKNLQNGANAWTDADTAALQARETALQAQIQFATDALSIANQSTALLLKLFQ